MSFTGVQIIVRIETASFRLTKNINSIKVAALGISIDWFKPCVMIPSNQEIYKKIYMIYTLFS